MERFEFISRFDPLKQVLMEVIDLFFNILRLRGFMGIVEGPQDYHDLDRLENLFGQLRNGLIEIFVQYRNSVTQQNQENLFPRTPRDD